VSLLLAPPLSRVLPDWHVRVAPAVWSPSELPFTPAATPPAAIPNVPGTPPREPAPPPHRPADYWPWAVATWAFGTCVLAIFFAAGAAHLARVAHSARAVDDARIAGFAETTAHDLTVPRRRFRLRWSDRASTPMTWGLWRPVVLLPAEAVSWDEDRLRHVLVHEIAHVKRWDVATQALSTLACVLYWFNPLVWWAARQMLVERERACDDLVLGNGARPSDYAHGLLDIARSLGADWTTSRVSPAMARRSQISGRLLAVLDPKRQRHGVRKPVVVAGAAVALALVLPTASLSFAPKPLSAIDIADTRTSILTAEASWRAALRNGDAAAMARFYTSDALLVLPNAHPARGRRGVSDVLQTLIGQGVVDVDLQAVEMYPVGEMLCEAGRATFWRSGGGVGLNVQYMTLWKKENGEWRIHRNFGAPQGEQR
jgi:ketosteroid isomerase-like protein